MEKITLVSTVNAIREALKSYKNQKPLFVVVDHAPCYVSAFEGLKNDIDLLQKTFGIRNYIERWVSYIQGKDQRFYNNFPVGNNEKGIKRISKIMHLFAYWYNHMRPHETF
jgi:transposase-like protein